MRESDAPCSALNQNCTFKEINNTPNGLGLFEKESSWDKCPSIYSKSSWSNEQQDSKAFSQSFVQSRTEYQIRCITTTSYKKVKDSRQHNEKTLYSSYSTNLCLYINHHAFRTAETTGCSLFNQYCSSTIPTDKNHFPIRCRSKNSLSSS